LYSDAWNVICHLQMIESHSSFLLKSYDDLHEKIVLILNHLVSLPTAEWRGHLVLLLGQSQKAIELLELLLKKALRSWETTMDCSWYGWECCNWYLMSYRCLLQLKDLRVDQWIEPCIRVNTRELDRELCTESSTLYT